MAELERELRALAAAVEFPPQPELARAVRARLAEPPRRRFAWRPLAVALAILALALGVAFAVPQARSAILRFLGLRGVRIELVEELPDVRVSGSLDLGDRVTLERAQRLVPYRILRPALLGKPDVVYLRGDQVSFLYGRPSRVRALFSQLPGRQEPAFFKKIAGPETRVEPVRVKGEPGFWLEGKPHFFVYVGPNGEPRQETLRLAGNTLLWQHGRLTLRLEGRLTKERALRIARSVR